MDQCDSIELHELAAYVFAGDIATLFWTKVCVPIGPALLYLGAFLIFRKATLVVADGVRAGAAEADADAARAAAPDSDGTEDDDLEADPEFAFRQHDDGDGGDGGDDGDGDDDGYGDDGGDDGDDERECDPREE